MSWSRFLALLSPLASAGPAARVRGRARWARWARTRATILGLVLTAIVALPATGAPVGARGIQAQYAGLRARLASSPFGQPLIVESTEAPRRLEGNIYAVIDYPYATVSRIFTVPAVWCDVLILHLNVKQCRVMPSGPQPRLAVAIGRKIEQPVSDAFPFEFAFSATAADAESLEVSLEAPRGPIGTRDYRIVLTAAAVDDRHTFVHLRYAYGFGMEGRMALRAYLATGGRGKVGFTTTGRGADGSPVFIDDVRGAIERNAMRYYLALDAYLGALGVAPAQQSAERFARWFDGTERYRLQLHEVEREAYLKMKRAEYARQQHP